MTCYIEVGLALAAPHLYSCSFFAVMPSNAALSSPRWIVPTYLRAPDSGWNHNGYAHLRLDLDRALKYEEILEQAGDMEDLIDEGGLEEVVLKVDSTPLVCHRISTQAQARQDFQELLAMSRDGGTAVEVPTGMELPTDKRDLHRPRLHVYSSWLEWSGVVGTPPNVKLKTGGLTRFDLARAKLYTGGPEHVRTAFQTLGRVAPHQALEVLEEGIHPPLPLEGARPRREVVGWLTKKDLMPLLRADNPRYRERALTALGGVEAPEPEDTDGGRAR